MKILTLNTWGGRAGKEGLLSFIAEQKKTVDVFCLQEMWSASYAHLGEYMAGGVDMSKVEIMDHGVQEIRALLDDYQTFFHPHHGDNYGLLTFVRNEIEVQETGEVFVYKYKGHVPTGDVGNHARNIQYVKIVHDGEPLYVLNFHGLWNGKGKTDSEDRINQSNKAVLFIQGLQGEVVFCGDFNLLPDTQSIKILEDAGLRNLIRENNIKSTRTSLYTKPEKFADYVFVSKGVEVKKFVVLHDEVSDHAPLVVEIE